MVTRKSSVPFGDSSEQQKRLMKTKERRETAFSG